MNPVLGLGPKHGTCTDKVGEDVTMPNTNEDTYNEIYIRKISAVLRRDTSSTLRRNL